MDEENVTADEYDDFRVSAYDPDAFRRQSLGVPNPMTPVRNTISPQPRNQPNLAADFRKSIKRTKADYTTLTDEKQWNTWKTNTISTAYAHGCENVVNPTYVPLTPEETLLFIEQKNFMYDVFLKIIQTPIGKHTVKKYEHSRDAQVVWREYAKYMKTSTRADIEIEDLMKQIVALHFDQAYAGSSQEFICTWLELVRQYEELTPVSSGFSDLQKKAMLSNALEGVKTFRDIKTSEQLDIAKGGGGISYTGYVDIVQKVAANYDNKMSAKKQIKPPTHLISQHEGHQGFDANGDDYRMMTPDEIKEAQDDEEYYGSFSINKTQQQQQP